MRILLVAVAGLLLVPSALAGTEADPEVSDAEADQKPELAVKVNNHMDILGAWFHDETDRSVNLTLKLKAIDPQSIGRYEISWMLMGRFQEQPLVMGVGAKIHPQQPATFFLLKPPAPDCRSNALGTVAEPIDGKIRGATIVWTIPFEKAAVKTGDRFMTFCARSLVEDAPEPQRVADSARSMITGEEIRDYQVGATRLISFGAISPHAPQPLLTDPEETELPAEYDLTGLYYEFLPKHLNITLRTRGFQRSALGDCTFAVSGHFASSDWDDMINIHLRMDIVNGTVRRVYTMDGYGARVTPNMSIQEGSPGYVRFSYPRNVWGNDTNVVEHTMRASIQHCKIGSDSIDYYDDSFWSPGTAWLGALGALGAAAMVRRRK